MKPSVYSYEDYERLGELLNCEQAFSSICLSPSSLTSLVQFLFIGFMMFYLGTGILPHTATDVPPHTIAQRINETMNDVVAHISLSTLFVDAFSFIPGTLYKITEVIPAPVGGIHDLSKRSKRRRVTNTTTSEGIPNATSSLHFFQRSRIIEIRNGAVTRRTKIADGLKWKVQIG
jgi:hypothetical protein